MQKWEVAGAGGVNKDKEVEEEEEEGGVRMVQLLL